MDLNALRKMARKQREAEEAEDNTAPEPTVKRVIPVEEPTADTAIYVPLEDDVVDQLPLPDDGYSVSSSVAEDEPKEEIAEERHGETLDEIIQKCFTDEKAYNIELERLLPFRRPIFTNVGDLTELKSEKTLMDLYSQLSRIEELRQKLSQLQPLNYGEEKRLLEEFAIRNTYNSNALEGCTLTLQETALIIKDGIAIAGHSLKEQLEVIGHKDAFYYIVEMSQSQYNNRLLDTFEINMLHFLTDDRFKTGLFRRNALTAVGSTSATSKLYDIERQMMKLLSDYGKADIDFFARMAQFHLGFETVYPFGNGNGRTGRLVLNLELLKGGYRPVDIKCTDKQRYCEAFDEYRNSGSTEAMKALLVEYELTELEEYVTIVEQA